MKKPQLVKRVVHLSCANNIVEATNYYKAGPRFYVQYRIEAGDGVNYLRGCCAAGVSIKAAGRSLACKFNKRQYSDMIWAAWVRWQRGCQYRNQQMFDEVAKAYASDPLDNLWPREQTVLDRLAAIMA